MKRKKIRHTREGLSAAIEKSKSWADVCRFFGIKPFTGSQTHIKSRAVEMGIDFSHFTGKLWAKGKEFGFKRPLDVYLNGSAEIKSNTLRRRLIKEGLKRAVCESCGLSEWMGGKIPLELDHVNSDHWDNAFSNLMVVCPNCHAVATNERRIKARKHKPSSEKTTCQCGRAKHHRSAVCMACRPQSKQVARKTKIVWPPIEVLIEAKNSRRIWPLAKSLGVSDVAVHKWIKRHQKDL